MGASPSVPLVPLSPDRTVIITGGNTGIGYETGKHLAIMGATVILACRSQQRALQAIERMKQEHADLNAAGKLPEGASQSLNVEFMKLDLGSLKSTMEFIRTFKASGHKLHVLLCNAGLAMLPRSFTEDGHETMFQVNYLSHFLLTAHLHPILKTSGEDCRIVFTSSGAHMYSEREFNESKIRAEKPAEYGRMLNYGSSKLFQIHHMFCLSRRLKGTNVAVTCIHPGIVRTEVTRSFNDSRKLALMFGSFKLFGMTKSPIQGATTLIDAAVNPRWRGTSDMYLVDCKPHSLHPCARNEEYQEKVWRYSLDCLKDYLSEDILAGLECK